RVAEPAVGRVGREVHAAAVAVGEPLRAAHRAHAERAHLVERAHVAAHAAAERVVLQVDAGDVEAVGRPVRADALAGHAVGAERAAVVARAAVGRVGLQIHAEVPAHLRPVRAGAHALLADSAALAHVAAEAA